MSYTHEIIKKKLELTHGFLNFVEEYHLDDLVSFFNTTDYQDIPKRFCGFWTSLQNEFEAGSKTNFVEINENDS